MKNVIQKIEVTKNKEEKIVISLREYKGRRYVDIRVHFLTSGLFVPTKKGIIIAEDFVAEVIEAMKTIKSNMEAN